MHLSMNEVLPKVIAWLLWLMFASGTAFFAAFLKSAPERTNTFASPSLLIPVCAALIIVLGCGALRYSSGRIRNPWLALVPYALGVIFCQLTLMMGVFLASEFLILFQGLCVAFFIAYLPPLTSLGGGGPLREATS